MVMSHNEERFQDWWTDNIRTLGDRDAQLHKIAGLFDREIVATTDRNRRLGYKHPQFHVMRIVSVYSHPIDFAGDAYDFLYDGIAISGKTYCGRSLSSRLYVAKDSRKEQLVTEVCMNCIKRLVLEEIDNGYD